MLVLIISEHHSFRKHKNMVSHKSKAVFRVCLFHVDVMKHNHFLKSLPVFSGSFFLFCVVAFLMNVWLLNQSVVSLIFSTDPAQYLLFWLFIFFSVKMSQCVANKICYTALINVFNLFSQSLLNQLAQKQTPKK